MALDDGLNRCHRLMMRHIAWVGLVLGLSSSVARAELRPFFNELQIEGGGAYALNSGVAPGVGGKFNTGIDIGTAGIEAAIHIFYGPQVFGTTAPQHYLGIFDLGLRLRIYLGKVALKIGGVYGGAFFPYNGSSQYVTGWGGGPSIGLTYLTSLDHPLYAGFGIEGQAMFMPFLMPAPTSLAILFNANVTAFVGARLTIFEKLISRR